MRYFNIVDEITRVIPKKERIINCVHYCILFVVCSNAKPSNELNKIVHLLVWRGLSRNPLKISTQSSPIC